MDNKDVLSWLESNAEAMATLKAALREHPAGGVAVYLPKAEKSGEDAQIFSAEFLASSRRNRGVNHSTDQLTAEAALKALVPFIGRPLVAEIHDALDQSQDNTDANAIAQDVVSYVNARYDAENSDVALPEAMWLAMQGVCGPQLAAQVVSMCTVTTCR